MVSHDFMVVGFSEDETGSDEIFSNIDELEETISGLRSCAIPDFSQYNFYNAFHDFILQQQLNFVSFY